MFTTRHAISLDFTSPRQRQVNEPSSTLPVRRIGGLLKLAIREGVGDRSSYYGLNVELRDAIRQVCRAVERLAGQP